MGSTLLITRPEHDVTTHYLSKWSEKIIKEAKNKGKSVIDLSQGATAYLGYKEDFWFRYNVMKISRPLEDQTAALFLEPSNYLVIALLKGHPTGYANNKSKALFRQNIEKLLIEGPSAEDYNVIRYLYWDMLNQVCLGDKEAIV